MQFRKSVLRSEINIGTGVTPWVHPGTSVDAIQNLKSLFVPDAVITQTAGTYEKQIDSRPLFVQENEADGSPREAVRISKFDLKAPIGDDGHFGSG